MWRSAGFSTPSGLSLLRPVSPLVTWELLEWISVCVTGSKQGRGLGSPAPGSSALQKNRAGHTAPLTLQYVRECHCVLFSCGPTSNPNRRNVQKIKKVFFGWPSFLPLLSCFLFFDLLFSLLTHTIVLFLFPISLLPSFLLHLLNTAFFILHYANLTSCGLITVRESLEAIPAQPKDRNYSPHENELKQDKRSAYHKKVI